MEHKASTARSDLHQILVDETAEPKALPLSLLEDITADFSHDREIGSGGFAVVYKGILGDRVVAVKKLSNNASMDETKFHREVQCLMQVKHKNIVRFLGYCADRQGQMARYNGKLVMADVHQRLLCFEYISKGSLDNYIIDARREWGICYKIIIGICEGLQYLHENHIVHLDLKPANILLDNNMIPKISDFGLSRCFNENQSWDVTKTILGTMGYMAPEFREGGIIACSTDMYSLGIIILEVLTGQKGYQAIGDVLESWSDSLDKSRRSRLCKQIQVCYEIALECRDFNPKKRPASVRHIIDRLHVMEITTADDATSISGVVGTESTEKGNADDTGRGAHAHPPAGQTVVMPHAASTSPRSGTLHAMPALPPPPSQSVVMRYLSSRPISKVYLSPELIYLKVSVIAAQDLIPADKGQQLAATITKIQTGHQIRRTRPQDGTVNPVWNEEFMFLATEPFEDPLVVTVEEKVAAGRDEPIGGVIIPVNSPHVPRNDLARSVPSKWFSLSRGNPMLEAAADVTTSIKFDSKIHLKLSLETAYHVLDESTHYSSNLQPAAKKLWKNAIGVLEVGILSARGLGDNKNPYCVVKYGAKWVRTRTLLATAAPQWNEQYTWDVFDLSTVITVAVFDNATLYCCNGANKDQRIGKVRVRLAMLESDRVYTHYYPLFALSPSGLRNTGELQLAVRFTCTAWANMLAQYGMPLLPKMHYMNPISELQLDYLRFQAMQLVAVHLSRAEPPLRREVVEYMLEVDSLMFSLRRNRAISHRIAALFSGVAVAAELFDGICRWKNPVATMVVHVMFLQLVRHPELILPMASLCMIMIGAWSYRRRPQTPAYIDPVLSRAEADTLPPESVFWYEDQAFLDELEEEFDTFPTSRSDDIVRMRYDRLRSIAGRLQTVVGDLATQAERAQSLLGWHDPRVTPFFITLLLVAAVVLYLTPFQLVAMVIGLYFLRPPWLRNRNNMLLNFYSRLPSKDVMML